MKTPKAQRPMTQEEQMVAFDREVDLLCNRFLSEFELLPDDLIPSLQYKCLMLMQDILHEGEK